MNSDQKTFMKYFLTLSLWLYGVWHRWIQKCQFLCSFTYVGICQILLLQCRAYLLYSDLQNQFFYNYSVLTKLFLYLGVALDAHKRIQVNVPLSKSGVAGFEKIEKVSEIQKINNSVLLCKFYPMKWPGFSLAHQFSERNACFLQKMREWAFCNKTSHSLTLHLFGEQSERFSHSRSFVKSNLSDSLTSLFKNEGMSESLVFTKKTLKTLQIIRFYCIQKNLSTSLVFFSVSLICSFAHKKWAICSNFLWIKSYFSVSFFKVFL